MTRALCRAIPSVARFAAILAAGTAFLACGGSPADASGDGAPGTGVVAVAVAPSSVSTAPASVIPFTAAVTGTTNRSVTWTVAEAGGGTVDGTGQYTAPSTTGVFHVVVTSSADPTKTATAQVTVTTQPTIAVSISPPSASTTTGATVAFTATVTGTTGSQSTAATWSVQEANGGTVDASGRYTAPTSAGTFHVVATSVADTARSATAAVVVTSSGGGSTDIISADRSTTWNPGILADGQLGLPLGADGIPQRTTICATLSPGASIQAAIDACPAGPGGEAQRRHASRSRPPSR